jgi:hypothetical protein
VMNDYVFRDCLVDSAATRRDPGAVGAFYVSPFAKTTTKSAAP